MLHAGGRGRAGRVGVCVEAGGELWGGRAYRVRQARPCGVEAVPLVCQYGQREAGVVASNPSLLLHKEHDYKRPQRFVLVLS